VDLTTGASTGVEKVFLTSDDLKTHLHGIGAPGSGKSKMIEWIARELIDQREGFCLIDPHGTLYHELVKYLAYHRPKREVILFNPSDRRRVVGFNPFRSHGDGDLSVYVDRLVQLIVRVRQEANTDEKPRLERILKAVLYTILELKLPLDTAQYLLSFTQRAIREHITKKLHSTIIRNEFSDLARLKAEDFRTQVEAVNNRLLRFLQSQQVRRIVNLDHHTLDFRDIIEGKKILLCNLHEADDALSFESASLLGTLMLNEIWTVAKQRKGRGGKDPHDFFVIMDEFQNFITPDIPEILPQSRKFGLKFMLFHQYLGQLRDKDESVYNAVMAVCQTKIVFGGLPAPDAEMMVKELFPGEINLERIKFLNQVVEFWPRVGRAEVRTEGDSEGTSHSSGGGSSFGVNVGSGSSYGPGLDDWVMSDSTTSIDLSTSMSSDTDSKSHSSGVSDVPFIYPEMHLVQKPPTYFSQQENEHQLAGLLVRQLQRHYFIRRSGKPTVAGISPFVKEYFVRDERCARYTEQCLAGYLTPDKVDNELEAMHKQLAIAARNDGRAHDDSDPWEKST
jgi:hypothetical protein